MLIGDVFYVILVRRSIFMCCFKQNPFRFFELNHEMNMFHTVSKSFFTIDNTEQVELSC